MPKEWYNADICKIKEGDSEEVKQKKIFNLSIVANKKPYFMCYIYPDTMKRYKDYIYNTDCKARMEFRLSIDELINKPNKTKKEKTFLEYYYSRMPVGIEPCLLNRICWKVENEFDGFLSKHIDYGKFDYSILKSNIIYSKNHYRIIKKLYEDYMNELSNYHTLVANTRIEHEEATTTRMEFKNRFKVACSSACPNEEELCNIILDICYKNNNTKQFAWDVCGETIINNLLHKNDNIINYPVADDNGDIQFGGCKFTMCKKVYGDDQI